MAEDFELIKTASQDLVDSYSNRNSDFDDYEEMFLLEDEDLPGQADIKKTYSPDARNTLLGAVRLMTATQPTFTVPYETNEKDVEKASSQIERWAAAIWAASGRVSRKPIEMPAVLSALLYDEIHIQVISTKALAARLKGSEKARAEAVATRTPLLFEVLNPKTGYPDFDVMGLRRYVSQQERRISDVIGLWGDKARTQLEGKKQTETIEYNEYWSIDTHCVWLEGQGEPLLLEDHGLPTIPVICQTVEGVNFFEDMEDTRQPFLYTLNKSQLWKRQNLMLTVLYTLAFSVGANPQMVAEMNDPDSDLFVDYSVKGGVIKIQKGESIVPLTKNVIDPSLMNAFDIAQGKVEESTIYKTALGQSLGANAPFSLVALLSQAGRLPLVPVQKMAGWALADAMYTGLQILREEGGKRQARGKGSIEIVSKDIPEVFDLECELEIDLPQDERQNAQIAMELAGGEDPMVSKRWAGERYLKIGQYDDMMEEIWAEKYTQMQFQREFVKRTAELQAQMQQEQQMGQGMPQQGPSQGMPPEMMQQGPPGMPPGQMPPEMMGPQGSPMGGQPMPPPELMQQQGAQPGLPMTEPMRPQGMPPEEMPPIGGGM